MPEARGRVSTAFSALLRKYLRDGVRPDGTPGALGASWVIEEFADKVGATQDTLRRWLSGARRPKYTVRIEETLFGDNSKYESYRRELRAAHEARRNSIWSSYTTNSAVRDTALQSGGRQRFRMFRTSILTKTEAEERRHPRLNFLSSYQESPDRAVVVSEGLGLAPTVSDEMHMLFCLLEKTYKPHKLGPLKLHAKTPYTLEFSPLCARGKTAASDIDISFTISGN
jgi:hypothetical protein